MATGDGAADWLGQIRTLTRLGSTGQTLVIVTVVVAALLGSAYALGRSLVPDQSPRRHATGTTADLNATPHYADQLPSDITSPSADRADGPTESRQDGTGRDAGGDHLYGAHTTTGDGTVALTFDDGPDPQYTSQVLAALREYGVRATFCLVGENAQNHPDLVRAIVDDGHTICNHSWNHDVTLGSRSTDTIRQDLLRTNAAIRAAVPDAPIVWYRQPGGAWTYPVVSVAHSLGMTPVHWTVDPADWEAPGASRISTSVLGAVEPGSVVLLHDAGGNRQGTVDALHRILSDLTSRFELEALPTDPT